MHPFTAATRVRIPLKCHPRRNSNHEGLAAKTRLLLRGSSGRLGVLAADDCRRARGRRRAASRESGGEPMADPTKDFEGLLRFFESRGAKVVVVGAHAVAYHAKPRY